MKIALGNDHAATDIKPELLAFLKGLGHEIENFGSDSADSVDYPDFAHPVAQSVAEGKNELGILLCGTGNGVSITANKNPKVRAGLAWNTEVAKLVKQHNNANVLCLPARFVTIDQIKEIIIAFFAATFEGGRHGRRVGKISG